MIDDLKLKKFLVVHSDGTRDITEAVNDEFLEIRYEEIDEKIESIEEIKIQKIKIVKYGSILGYINQASIVVRFLNKTIGQFFTAQQS